MLALAMAFLTEPKLLMIDELSLGLAPVVVEQLLDVVRELRDRGTTIILVEQSVNVALTVADTAYFMEKGEMRFHGPTSELLERPDVLRSVFLQGAAATLGTDGHPTAGPATPHLAAESSAPSASPGLRVSEVSMAFGGIRAVDEVSFEVAPGEVIGLIGPNGAGKTTLLDLISGYLAPESGHIHLGDTDITGRRPHERALVGLGRSFQDSRLFPSLTVEETLLVALERLENLIDRYPLRGIKGPMGTSQDMLDLLDGDATKLADLERRVASHLGFEQVLTSVGQVYPRSLDFDVVSALVQLVAGPSNLATTIRLMAGIELVTEGFKEGQVGSSAMPHKMNTRSCERVNGLAVIVRGHLSMVSELAGDQWNEGDVSCSVVRRVALPDAFFATDGLFQTFLTVLDEFGAFPAVIQRELDRYLPFLTTTKVLMTAVRNGVGREQAHEAIKAHAVAVALEMRQGLDHNDLYDRLAADARLGLTREQIDALVRDPIEFTGAAVAQVQAVVRRVEEVVAADPAAAAYAPGAIL